MTGNERVTIQNVLKIFFPKASVGPTRLLEEQIFLSCYADKKESLINHSALFCCAQRRVITCGTHFEETKLVASITGRPVPESMSISWIFTPVETISWGTMKLKLLFLDLIPLKMGGTTSRYIFFFSFATLPANHTAIFFHMLNLALAGYFEISENMQYFS